MASVIVFGPTGNVGSITALTAADKGAKVALAMRDTNKTIAGLSKEQEQAGNFTRVHADLLKPDTVAEAVKTTGAKRAYIYLAFGAQDHMRSTIEALKSAGVELVVFLSSFTVPQDKPLRDVPPSDIIDYMHSQVEANLDEIYGSEGYVALRCGSFATNLLRDKDGIVEGKVPLFASHTQFDNVTAQDMGEVGGVILANGQRNGQSKVYIYGPELISHRQAIEKIGKAVGKDVKIQELSEEEAREHYKKFGFPPPFIDYFIRMLSKTWNGTAKDRFPSYDEGVENVKSYTGREPTTYDQWIQKNKELFTA